MTSEIVISELFLYFVLYLSFAINVSILIVFKNIYLSSQLYKYYL